MKKRRRIIPLALFMALLTACGTSGAVSSVSPGSAEPTSASSVTSSESEEQQAARQTVEHFFAAFTKEDYETMKTYCTKQFAQASFGENQETEYWYGFKTAKLEEANLVVEDAEALRAQLFPDATDGYLFDITMKGETVPESSLWVEDDPVQLGFGNLLLQKVDGNWKIAGIEIN